MSEVATKEKATASKEPKAAKEPCSTSCGCKESNGTNGSTGAKKVVIQNGKGSAPRNMGPKYLSNFDRIKWQGDPSLKPAVGQKAVKVYR